AADPVTVVARVTAGGIARGARLRLRLPAATPVEWGDTLECLVQIERPGPRRNPGGFEPRASADAAAIVAVGRAWTARVHKPGGLAALGPRTLARWRRGIESRLQRHLSPPALELTLPLVTGDRSAVSIPLDADLRSAGLIHLLALSGLHVAAL